VRPCRGQASDCLVIRVLLLTTNISTAKQIREQGTNLDWNYLLKFYQVGDPRPQFTMLWTMQVNLKTLKIQLRMEMIITDFLLNKADPLVKNALRSVSQSLAIKTGTQSLCLKVTTRTMKICQKSYLTWSGARIDLRQNLWSSLSLWLLILQQLLINLDLPMKRRRVLRIKPMKHLPCLTATCLRKTLSLKGRAMWSRKTKIWIK
jgi:hypothetical protein